MAKRQFNFVSIMDATDPTSKRARPGIEPGSSLPEPFTNVFHVSRNQAVRVLKSTFGRYQLKPVFTEEDPDGSSVSEDQELSNCECVAPQGHSSSMSQAALKEFLQRHLRLREQNSRLFANLGGSGLETTATEPTREGPKLLTWTVRLKMGYKLSGAWYYEDGTTFCELVRELDSVLKRVAC